MNWKQFKNWLDQNIFEVDDLLVKVKDNKQDKYGNLSTQILTNFCDSLEATLDNNSSYHLFPTFSDNKDFEELFNYQDCHFGKKTAQEKMTKDDYKLLEKMFEEWKSTQKNHTTNTNINNPTMVNTRNILLIGRTGSGKSTLANVLMGNEGSRKFTESSRSVSATKYVEEGFVDVDLSKDGKEKIKYRVIDTIGIGDTQLTPQGVLSRLSEMADWVKQEGLNQVFFVNKGRFNKEEIEAYDLLSSIIFDEKVLDYTTVVRTDFLDFEDREECANDREALRRENADLAHILAKVNIIYVDNPPLKGRNASSNEETRAESRKKLFNYLATCQGNYRPSNIDTLDERVRDYKTNEQKLKEKMKELEKARKQQEEEFRRKLADMKEEQKRELRENRRQFEEDLHKAKVESDEKLRTTVNDLEDKQKKKMEEQDQKNKEQLKQSEEKSKQEIKEVKDSQEKMKKDHQEDLRKNREETENLRKQLNEKKDNSDIVAQLEALKTEDKEVRLKELKIQEEREKREQDRLDRNNNAEQARKDKIANEEAKLKEQQRKAAEKKAFDEAKERALNHEQNAAGLFETIGKTFTGWNNS